MKSTLFGTDGIRGHVGQEPLTLEALVAIGRAFGVWAVKRYGTMPHIVIAHDTRISSSFVKTAIKCGLLLSPVQLYDAQVLPTPAVCQLVQKTNLFSCGIIISASHNPFYDNGIKIVTEQGKLLACEEAALMHLIKNHKFEPIVYQHFGTDQPYQEAKKFYCDHIQSFFRPNFLQGKTIVLDCANGANYELAPYLFSHFGANVIVINNEPNGTNINDNCGSLYPAALVNMVRASNADMGFSFDGDGDRVIAVNSSGELKNGDHLLAILLTHSQYKNESTVVGTILSNGAFEQFLVQHKKQLLRSAVGDKQVSQFLQDHHLLLGGEPSGHLIMRDYLDSGDGIFAALKVAQTIIETNNLSMTSFVTRPQIQIDMPIAQKKDLSEPCIARIINAHTAQLHAGRLIVRYSGTENILRITAEDADHNHAQLVATALSHELQKYL